MVQRPTRLPGVGNRLSDRSKRVLAQAASEAARLGYAIVETEHVLLGLVATGSVPPDVPELSALAVDQLRHVVESVLGRGHQMEPLEGFGPSDETRRIIELGVAEANRLGVVRVEPRHVLLGLVSEPGRAGAILKALRLSPEAIRDRMLRAERRL